MSKNQALRISIAAACCSLSLVGQTSHAADAGPTVAKDSVLVNAHTLNVYKKDYDKWSWVPRLAFRVNGPIPSGGQLYADFSIPGGGSIKFDCQTQETAAGRSYRTECGGTALRKTRARFTPARSASKSDIRNELAGTDVDHLQRQSDNRQSAHQRGRPQGEAQVRVLRRPRLEPAHRLRLPQAGDVTGWKAPTFLAAFWVRGDATNFQPHLFYQGKEVGKMFYQGDEVGKASCESDIETEVTQQVEEKRTAKGQVGAREMRFSERASLGQNGREARHVRRDLRDEQEPRRLRAQGVVEQPPGSLAQVQSRRRWQVREHGRQREQAR